MILEQFREFFFRRYDYLKITDENNVPVGQYCGELTGEEVLVGGVYAVLTFHSDHSNQKRGFLLFFTSAKPSKCNRYAARFSTVLK